MPSATQFQKTFDIATDVRKFEIGLFWQRSLFFWGFIGAAFVAYGALIDFRDRALIVACFGFVCSVAWSLVNRGSKYWQEFWEQEVERVEGQVLGAALFNKEGEIQRKGAWLGARRYSVSKLAIALSDFTILVWLVLGSKVLPRPFTLDVCQVPEMLVPLVSLLFSAAMMWAGRSTPRRP